MKILVDQNISYRLIPHIKQAFPDVHHVKTLGLIDARDTQIFQYARENNFAAILTLDEDFYNILLSRGTPPKVIWLRLKNASVPTQAQHIMDNVLLILHFLNDDKTDCLEIF